MHLAAGVGFTYFALNVLTFGGVFHNAADEWLMFAVTESLVKWGRPSVDQLYWVGEYMGWARFGLDGHLYVPYTNFSTGQELVGTVFYNLARLVPGAGLAQGTLLTNAALASLSLSALVLVLGALGYGAGVSLVAVALVGLATPLWPYAQTYYGEPLLGLLFLLVAGCLVGWTRSAGTTRWALGLGTALAAAVVAKPPGVLFLPFALAYLLVMHRRRAAGLPWRSLAAVLLPTAVAGLALVVFSAARFGPGEGYVPSKGFDAPLLVGLPGLLVSPGKGILFYAPASLLAVPGLYLLGRRPWGTLALTLALFCLTYLIFFALWSEWYGGRTSWGPRTLVPLLPLLGLGIAGWLEGLRRRRLAWGTAALAGGAGFLVEVPAVLNNYLPALLELTKRYPAPIATEGEAAARAFGSWSEAPFLTLWRGLAPGNSDIAWLWGERGLDTTALAVSLLLFGLALIYLWLAFRRPSLPGLRLAPVGVGVVCALGVAFLLPRYAEHPHYGSAAYRQALAEFASQASPNATLVTLDTTMQAAFNFQTGANPRYGLSGNIDTANLPPELDRLLQGRIGEGGEVWLVATQPEERTVERRLRELLPQVRAWQWDDVRLLSLRDVYATPPATAQRVDARYGNGLRLLAADVEREAQAGESVPVDLFWRADSAQAKNLSVSVQVLDASGKLVAQQDGPPAEGKLPMADWQAGKTVLDQHEVALPADLPEGRYSLVAILYDAAVPDGARTPRVDGEDRTPLGTITVGG